MGCSNPDQSVLLTTYLRWKKLGVNFQQQQSQEPHPYLFASKGSVGVSFTANATADTAGDGKLDISFSKEGSTYFAAIDCTVSYIDDTSHLVEQLIPHKDDLDWGDLFIVTSVTTAKKALIMQSNTSSAQLSIEGNVKGLQPGVGIDLNASAGLKINSYKDSSFIKPWSDQVGVFFTLSRFSKKLFGGYGLKTRSLTLDSSQDEFELDSVSPEKWIEAVSEK